MRGLFLERWEEFKARWNHYIPIISVDKFINDIIKEMQDEYPVWKKVIEDLEPDDDGFKALTDYVRKLWRWIWKWY